GKGLDLVRTEIAPGNERHAQRLQPLCIRLQLAHVHAAAALSRLQEELRTLTVPRQRHGFGRGGPHYARQAVKIGYVLVERAREIELPAEAGDGNDERVVVVDAGGLLDIRDPLTDDPDRIDHHGERDGDLQRDQNRA